VIAADLGVGRIKRVPLISRPTPLEHWARLSDELGIRLLVKRDDLTGLGMGGNKLRKLEYIFGTAKERGITAVLTTGGAQSNHARLTAAVAAKFGLRCFLYLRGEAAGRTGNLLLDALLGAEVRLLGNVDYSVVYEVMASEEQRLRQEGENPLSIPLGGATVEGTVGYVAAFQEVEAQLAELGETADAIFLAAGTASTYAGLRLAAHYTRSSTEVIGISVSWSRERLQEEAGRLIHDTAMLLRLPVEPVPTLFDDRFIGPGYALPSEAGMTALLDVARKEGVLLDNTYTGKAFSGLIGAVRQESVRKGSTVVFLHTGGVSELFARDLPLEP
jgi:D-cysteine desulfhydrase